MPTPQLVEITATAVLQAYADYEGGTITAPDGYAAAGSSFYAWESLAPGVLPVAKKFALVFRSVLTPGLFLVAFRGTETPDEWIADATFPFAPFPEVAGIQVEEGFLNLYAKGVAGQSPVPLRDSLFQYFQSVTVTQMIVTGHSLGSSLASLFAFDVAKKLKVSPTLVTYASPNVGDAAWAAAFSAAVPDATRIFNNQDVVPFLPPTAMRYVSVGTNWPVEFNPQIIWDRAMPMALLTNHSMSNYSFVSGHAAGNTSQDWAGVFPDQSQETSWPMQSLVPAAGVPLGVTLAEAHLEFLSKLQAIHGL